MNFIWGWVQRHWSSVGIGLILCWLSIGATYVIFIRPTTGITVGAGGKYIQASDGFQPTFGCATGRQFFGWAHQSEKHK